MRHLAYYCYPRACRQKWRNSVEHLLSRWDQFDGRKLVTIATDQWCNQPEDVIEAFDGRGCEFVVRENVPGMQETAHLVEQLAMLEGETGIVLRCHSKGSTHPEHEAPNHPWLDAMAAACLDCPQLVDCAMERAHVAGAFRSIIPFGSSSWHFAGSFYWLKLSELFARDWRRIDQAYFGVESYPGTQFQLSESACLFFDNASGAMLYDRTFHEQNVIPSLTWWKARLSRGCAEKPCNR